MKKEKFPETSLEAFLSQTPEKLRTDYAKIVLALQQLKKANYDKISSHIGFNDVNAVSRRIPELIKAGLVYKTGTTSLTSRGRKAREYALVTEGQLCVTPESLMPGKSVGDFAAGILNVSPGTQGDLFQK